MASDMRKLLKEWQHRLGLDNWIIVLEYDCKPDEMELKDVAGESDWVEEHQCAIIRLLDEKYYGKRIKPFDKEKTLVHELLHLKFTFVWNNENVLEQRIVHQIIESIAEALVDAKRSGNGDKL